MTSLNVYGTNAAATTITTANKLATGTGGAETTASTLIGKATKWGEVWSQGNIAPWAAATSEPSPSGHGWLLDATTLEGSSLNAGNWVPIVRLQTSIGSIVADIHVRFYVRSSSGAYTPIGDMTLSGQSINTALSTFTFASASFTSIAFGTGDKLYVDCLLNITTNSTNQTLATLKCGISNSGTSGNATDMEVDTPGYTAASTTVAYDWSFRGNIGQLISRDWQFRANLGHVAQRDWLFRARITTPTSRDFTFRANIGLQTRDFAFRANIGLQYHSPVDQHLYKAQMALVYTPAGVFIDCWPDAPLLAGFKESINAAVSSLQVQLPRSFENYDPGGRPPTIAQGNIVKYYLFGPGLPPTGLLRYQGVIDSFDAQVDDAGGETLTVTLIPQSSVVSDHGITGTHNFGTPNVPTTYVDPISMFTYFFQNIDPNTGQTYTFPLTLDPTNPTSSGLRSQFTMQDQTVGSCWEAILKLLPVNWYFRTNEDLSVTLNVPPVTAQHTFTIGQDISSPQYSQSWQAMKNIIRAKGVTSLTAGTTVNTDGTFNASTSTTINNKFTSSETATSNPSVSMNQPPSASTSITQAAIYSLKKGSDVTAFGARIKYHAEDRISDQNTLNAFTQGMLNQLDQIVLRAKIRLMDYRGDINQGLGFDIETVKVGDTCMILDVSPNDKKYTLWGSMVWDVSDWDFALGSAISTVVVVNAITYGFDYLDVELGSIQPSMHAVIHQQRRDFDGLKMML